MKVDKATQDALEQASPPLPPSPPVEAIEAEPYEDSSGEESLQIWVILGDSTRDEDLTGEHVMQLKSAIRERLLSRGIRLFPYIRLVRRSEYHPPGIPQ